MTWTGWYGMTHNGHKVLNNMSIIVKYQRVVSESVVFAFEGCVRWQTASSKTWSTSSPLCPLRSLPLILRPIKPVLWVSAPILTALKVRLDFLNKLSLLFFRSFYETHASGLQQAVVQSGLQAVQVPAAVLPQSLRQAHRRAGGFASAGRWWLRHGPHQHRGHCRGQNGQRGVGHPAARVGASVSDLVKCIHCVYVKSLNPPQLGSRKTGRLFTAGSLILLCSRNDNAPSRGPLSQKQAEYFLARQVSV